MSLHAHPTAPTYSLSEPGPTTSNSWVWKSGESWYGFQKTRFRSAQHTGSSLKMNPNPGPFQRNKWPGKSAIYAAKTPVGLQIQLLLLLDLKSISKKEYVKNTINILRCSAQPLTLVWPLGRSVKGLVLLSTLQPKTVLLFTKILCGIHATIHKKMSCLPPCFPDSRLSLLE